MEPVYLSLGTLKTHIMKLQHVDEKVMAVSEQSNFLNYFDVKLWKYGFGSNPDFFVLSYSTVFIALTEKDNGRMSVQWLFRT